MRRSRLSRTLVVLLLVASMVTLVGAGPPPGRPTPGGPPEGKGPVTIPEHAVQVAPGVFYLGTAVDKGRIVEGYAFVRYKKGFAKPGTDCGNGICEPGENARKCPVDCPANGEDPEPDTSSCYGFLAKGAKWKTIEPYIVDPTNIRGLDEEDVRSNFALDILTWETAAGVDVLGDEIAGMVDGADTVSPDNQNEVYFADVGYEGAIAITIVWGVFGGPPPRRYLVEWDQVYDDKDFNWSADCLAEGEDCKPVEECVGLEGLECKMDFENIATHELGHSVGLDDLYPEQDPGCSEQTMWGYADYGETNKRDLEAGDITGVSKLYE